MPASAIGKLANATLVMSVLAIAATIAIVAARVFGHLDWWLLLKLRPIVTGMSLVVGALSMMGLLYCLMKK